MAAVMVILYRLAAAKTKKPDRAGVLAPAERVRANRAPFLSGTPRLP